LVKVSARIQNDFKAWPGQETPELLVNHLLKKTPMRLVPDFDFHESVFKEKYKIEPKRGQEKRRLAPFDLTEERPMNEKQEIIWMSGLEIAGAIKEGRLSPVEVVEAYLARIEEVNPEINAYVTLTAESARKEAREAERILKTGDPTGPLHGVPVAIKDNMPVRGVRTTWGSKLYADYIPEQDYILVERLRKAGAIILGKTNVPEFCLMGATENPLFGVTKNPWNLKRTPGGSSGGSAAALAAGMCPLTVGNDGGGSIRIPGSFCGVYGLKPHLGRIPRWPALPGWESVSSEGPITRTVADAALLLDIMAGPDQRDYLSLPSPGVDYRKGMEDQPKGNRLAFSPDLGYAVVDPEVAHTVRKAAFTFKDLGFEVEEVTLDFLDLRADWATLIGAETVAAIDGRMEEWKEVGFQPYLGWMALGEQLAAVDYVKAMYRRKELWEKVRKVFDCFDFLLTPTMPIPAFPISAGMGPEEIAGQKVGPAGFVPFTIPFNMTGQPAATVPCGFTKDHLPIGLQIVGNRFDELGVLQVSRAFEKAFPWKNQRPDL
jgi:aspartyl-tRNA(Asn)/glutamyl-tRNA(Gln) amidotransferase subunit A